MSRVLIEWCGVMAKSGLLNGNDVDLVRWQRQLCHGIPAHCESNSAILVPK